VHFDKLHFIVVLVHCCCHLCGLLQDADDDEDAGAGAVHQEEWMARVAVLLRANPVSSFNQLADLLLSNQQALAAAASAGADPSQLLEQLYWLARMAAHALADTGVGEVPLPPEAVLLAVGENSPHCVQACETTGAATHRLQQATPEQQQAAASAGAAAVDRLARALLELTTLCLNPAAAPVISPRLMEACIWGAARWADTYLFPEEEEPLPAPLHAAFGDANGRSILDMLVTVSQHCLVSFTGETELHRQVGGGGDCWPKQQLLSLMHPNSSWQVRAADCSLAAASDMLINSSSALDDLPVVNSGLLSRRLQQWIVAVGCGGCIVLSLLW